MKKKDDSSNRVTIQFFTLSNHKNLATFSLTQNVTSEAVANMQGDDGENSLAQRRKNRIQAQNESVADIEFIQHFEYVFSAAEQKRLGQLVDNACDEAQKEYPNWNENDQLAFVKLEIYRHLCDINSNGIVCSRCIRDVAKNFKIEGRWPDNLDLRGIGCWYLGGYTLGHIKRSLDQFSCQDSVPMEIDSTRISPKIKRSVDWKNGVPCKMTIDIDFSKDADKIKGALGRMKSHNN